MTHTFVIAECGSCHDNSFTKALRLIDAAVAAGADAAKFQYWSSAAKLAARRGLGPDAKAVYEKYQLPKSWLPNLKEYCDGSGIEFMCTTYLLEDIAQVAPLVKRFKISAYESGWNEFVQAHREYARQVIYSRGEQSGTLQFSVEDDAADRVKLLYCVSKYPTNLEDLHLKTIHHRTPDPMMSRHSVCWWPSVYVGLSDHTVSTVIGAVAVGCGATFIEKHLRLVDTHTECPDYGHSLDPQDFRTYVSNIREAELAL